MRRTATQKEAVVAGFVPAIQAPSRRDKTTVNGDGVKRVRYSTLTRLLLPLPAGRNSLLLASQPGDGDL